MQLLRYACPAKLGDKFPRDFPGRRAWTARSPTALPASIPKPTFMPRPARWEGLKRSPGYATSVRGEQLAFSILSNNLNLPAKRVTDTIDALVEALVNDSCQEIARRISRADRFLSPSRKLHGSRRCR